MPNFKTMADVRAANESAGNNFFSRETIRWWKSRVESSLIKGRYFVTSEDDWHGNRIYCARMVRDDASIQTLKTHLRTKADAKEVIRLHSLGLEASHAL